MNNPVAQRRISGELPWLGIVIFITLAVAFLLPVLPNDFWWYLRLGRDILTTGHIPAVDTYSSTITGQPVSYPMWLSSIVLYALFKTSGVTTVVLVRGICVAMLYGILWLICVKNGLPGWLAALLTTLSALAGANNWAVRPQMLVYPLFGLTLLILSDAFHGNKKKLAWLIPIALVWANLHGSVILFFLLTIPVWLFHARNKTVFIILLLAFLATWINPRGPLMWVDAFGIIGAKGNTFSQEWNPSVNTGWQMNLFFIWLLAFIPLASFSPRKLNWTQWIWFLGFGWMALSGVRYVIWFLGILLILTGWLISGWKIPAPRFDRSIFIVINVAFVAIMILSSFSLLPGLREKWWKKAPQTYSNDTPFQATAWLKQHPELPDPIFNDYVFGSYLIYALPDRPVWIDSRFYPYSKTHWEDYLGITSATPGWNDKLKGYKIATLMLNVKSQPGLISELTHNKDWCQYYADEQAVIFSRCP